MVLSPRPFSILGDFEEPGVLSVDIAHGIDVNGIAYASMTNVDFGTYMTFPISGFEVQQ